MANYKVTDSELIIIADAIRTKGGTSASLAFPSGFVSAISAISGGGSGVTPTYGSKTILSNGEYDPESDGFDAFSHVTVSVPSGSSPVLVSKTISENGTYNPASDNADGYSQVVVSVSGGGEGSSDDFDILLGLSNGTLYHSSVENIPDYFGRGRSTITAVSFPECLSIGTSAFQGCYNLTNISIPKCETIKDNSFANCDSLSEINIPAVKSVPFNAFYSCNNLEKINAPEVTLVSNSAFYSCHKLQAISLPKCSIIGSSAFASCYNLLSVYLLSDTIVSLKTGVFTNTPISNRTTSTGGVYGSIYVPESLYETYISANQWSAYAARFVSVQSS